VHAVSKIMACGWLGFRAGRMGSPVCQGFPLRAKLIQASLMLAASARASGMPLVIAAHRSALSNSNFFGERSLQVAVAEFLSHFHAERNHQGLGNRLIEPGKEVGRTWGDVACRERLGGMLRYYYRQAA
jgi:hypothetical protein